MSTMQLQARPRWRRVMRKIVTAAIVLFVIALMARVFWGFVEGSRYNYEIAKIKAAGEPLVFADLDAGQPTVKEADDAGPYYEAAMALVRGHNEESKPLWNAWSEYFKAVQDFPTSQPSSQAREKLESLLAENALALDMLDRGAKCSQCWFDIGIEQGMETCMKKLSCARAAAKILIARALIQASQGKGDEAVDSLICLLKFTRVFDRRPVTVVYLVKIACLSLACGGTEVVLSNTMPSEPALARLATCLQSADQPTMLTRMLLAERIYAMQLMINQMILGNDGVKEVESVDPNVGQWFASGFWTRPLVQHWSTGMLVDYAEFIRISLAPSPEALKVMKVKCRGSSGSLFGRILAPALEQTFAQTERASAQIRCASLAIAIDLYRRSHGQLPTGLAELDPRPDESILIDPFTGKDLLYRHNKNDFVVYSVGENKVDDGGILKRREGQGPPPDSGIRVVISAPAER